VSDLRDVHFAMGHDTDPVWNRHAVEFTAAANGISLMMPHVEPSFVATTRRALPLLDDELAATAERFARQELQHQGQHRAFNAVLVARFPGLAAVERRIARTYRWITRTRSLRFNLAFVAASESIAYSLARWTSDHLAELLRDADPTATDLFLWHLAEEVEHKSVAHDVWAAVDGSRLRHAWAALCSLVLVAGFDLWATVVQLHALRRLHLPGTWFRMVRLSFSFAFDVVPALAVASMPGHHPSQLTDPSWYGGWLADLEHRQLNPP
jgi:predicted metal-dependent hydrolase